MTKRNDGLLPKDDDRLEFLAQIASMYYEQDMTQQEICERMGYSRSGISRLLTEAHDTGVVEIRIHYPMVRNRDLELTLARRFPFLSEVRVLGYRPVTYSQMLRGLGGLAARLVEQIVRNDMIIGVSWGTGVYEVANALRAMHVPGIRVVQLIGALGTPDPQIDGPELARWIARVFGGRYQVLPAPLVVDSPEVRNALVADSRIREVLEVVRQAHLAIVGIGTTLPSMSSWIRAGYLTEPEMDQVIASGGVGDVCAALYDQQGHLLDIPLMQRVVGITAAALRQIPLVIGVAGGEIKAPAILGALRAQLISGLVTDETAARIICELDAPGGY